MRQTKGVMMAGDKASTSLLHSWSALDGSKVETITTFPPYKGIVLGEGQNSAKAIPIVLKDDNALGIDHKIQKTSEQLNWTNPAIKGLEMNVIKFAEIKHQFDAVQFSLNDVNKIFNDVQYTFSVVRGCTRESSNKIEEVGEKMVEQFDSTKGIISELVEKVGKMSVSKTDKPVPDSFLHKRSVKIQDPIKPMHRFPFLLPKETVVSQKEELSEHISLASLFEEEEATTKVLPRYEPLENRFNQYPAPDLAGKENFQRHIHSSQNPIRNGILIILALVKSDN